MATRYLYGDSEPFAEQYDFLAALKSFVTFSCRVLVLQHQCDALERGLSDRAQSDLYTHEALQKFFGGLVDAIAERALRSTVPHAAGPYGNALISHVEKMAAEARALHAKGIDETQIAATVAIRERRAEMREVLSRFLLEAPLPIDNWALSVELTGAQAHGQAILSHPPDVLTEFALEILRDERWSRPRRVSDFAQSLQVQVGFKKNFLRSSLVAEIIQLDDFFLSGFELGPDSAEVRLRRRLDDPRDSFLISVEPQEGGLDVVRVKRLDDEHAGDAPYVSLSDDAMRIVAFVDVLRSECESLLRHRRKLLSAQVDGRDVFERGSMMALIARIVDRFAPIAAEVSRRSPNPNELSLKVEKADGRREELYVRKRDLVALGAECPNETLVLFQRLSLVPGTDSAAGNVAAPPTPAAPTALTAPPVPVESAAVPLVPIASPSAAEPSGDASREPSAEVVEVASPPIAASPPAAPADPSPVPLVATKPVLPSRGASVPPPSPPKPVARPRPTSAVPSPPASIAAVPAQVAQPPVPAVAQVSETTDNSSPKTFPKPAGAPPSKPAPANPAIVIAPELPTAPAAPAVEAVPVLRKDPLPKLPKRRY